MHLLLSFYRSRKWNSEVKALSAVPQRGGTQWGQSQAFPTGPTLNWHQFLLLPNLEERFSSRSEDSHYCCYRQPCYNATYPTSQLIHFGILQYKSCVSQITNTTMNSSSNNNNTWHLCAHNTYTPLISMLSRVLARVPRRSTESLGVREVDWGWRIELWSFTPLSSSIPVSLLTTRTYCFPVSLKGVNRNIKNKNCEWDHDVIATVFYSSSKATWPI